MFLALISMVAAQNDCSNTPGLCLPKFELTVGQSVDLFWNQDQIPATVIPSTMVLSLYQGDVHFITQPCQIDKDKYPLIEQVPFTYSSNGKSSITIPSTPALTNAIKTDNRFFLQLGNTANVNCQIGPNAQAGAITHFVLADAIPVTTTTTKASTTITGLPTNTNDPPSSNNGTASNSDSKSLSTTTIIIISVAAFLLILISIFATLFCLRRRRQSSKETIQQNRNSTDLQNLVPSKEPQPQSQPQSRLDPIALQLDPIPQDPELGTFFKLDSMDLLPPSHRKGSGISELNMLTPKDAKDISQAFKNALSDPVKSDSSS